MWLILSNGVNRVNHGSQDLGDVRPAHPEVPSEVSPGLDGDPVQQGHEAFLGLPCGGS